MISRYHLDACPYGGLTATNLTCRVLTSINRLSDPPTIIAAKHPMSSQRLAEGLTITKPGDRDAAVAEVIVECR
jgi:hypothetical protein